MNEWVTCEKDGIYLPPVAMATWLCVETEAIPVCWVYSPVQVILMEERKHGVCVRQREMVGQLRA